MLHNQLFLLPTHLQLCLQHSISTTQLKMLQTAKGKLLQTRTLGSTQRDLSAAETLKLATGTGIDDNNVAISTLQQL